MSTSAIDSPDEVDTAGADWAVDTAARFTLAENDDIVVRLWSAQTPPGDGSRNLASVVSEAVSQRAAAQAEGRQVWQPGLLADIERLAERELHVVLSFIDLFDLSLPNGPTLDEMIETWAEESVQGGVPARTLAEIKAMPVPVYGSPPQAWTALQKLVASTPAIAASGTLAVTGHPVLAILTPAAHFIVWMGKPAARIARRSLGETAARALRTPSEPGDFD